MSTVIATCLIANQQILSPQSMPAPRPGCTRCNCVSPKRPTISFVDPLPGGLSRRKARPVLGGTAAPLCFSRTMPKAQQASDNPIMRPIPSSGEKLPVIGLGTWQTFDVDPAQSAPLAEVLRTFVKFGGRVV